MDVQWIEVSLLTQGLCEYTKACFNHLACSLSRSDGAAHCELGDSQFRALSACVKQAFRIDRWPPGSDNPLLGWYLLAFWGVGLGGQSAKSSAHLLARI